jgi:hypothetical protein
MAKRTLRTEPPQHVPDVFASDFDVHDWEDWLRLICWTEVVEPGRGDGDAHTRLVAAAIVMPRSSLLRLLEVLRISSGARSTVRAHS